VSQLSADEAAGGTTSLYFALMMSFSGNTKTSGTILGVQVTMDGIEPKHITLLFLSIIVHVFCNSQNNHLLFIN